MSSIIGRAGTASLEMAVEVLDTLGSSISNLKSNSGFVSGFAARGNKISILAFEVANTIAKGANLLRSLSEENIQSLKDAVLKSDGIKKLVSADNRELLIIAATDKRCTHWNYRRFRISILCVFLLSNSIIVCMPSC